MVDAAVPSPRQVAGRRATGLVLVTVFDGAAAGAGGSTGSSGGWVTVVVSATGRDALRRALAAG